MKRNTRKTITLVGMGLMAGASLGLTATAASANTVHADHDGATVANHGVGDHDGQGDHRGGSNQHDGRGGHDGRGDRDVRFHSVDWRARGAGGQARTYTVALFQGRNACETAGHYGEWLGQWDDSACVKVGGGNVYALQAVDYQGRHRVVRAAAHHNGQARNHRANSNGWGAWHGASNGHSNGHGASNGHGNGHSSGHGASNGHSNGHSYANAAGSGGYGA